MDSTILLYCTLPFWSIIFSLISKKTLFEIDAKSYTAAVLLITSILSLLYNYFTKTKTKVNLYSILAGCAFGLGTLLFEEAVHIASNPGIVNGVYRSQAALTAIASVFILGSKLNYISMLGILITIAGAFVIGMHKQPAVKENYEPCIIEDRPERKNEKIVDVSNKKWLYLVLIAGILSTVKDISGVFSVKGGKMKPTSFVFSQCFFGAIMVLIYQYITNGKLIPSLRTGGNWKDALIGIISAGFDNFIWCGVLIYLMANAKNPAYPKAVTMLGIPLTAMVSPLIFDIQFPDTTQLGGIAAVVLGIGLLAYK